MRADRLFLLSTEARALAASAVRSGARPIVFDCFGDRETRVCSWLYVPLRVGKQGIDGKALISDLTAIAADGGPGMVVYGSGFESQPGLLDRVRDSGYAIAGNDSQVVRAAKDPAVFFALLKELKIPHPEVSFKPHGAAHGWLLKNPRASGGWHVRGYKDGEALAPGWLLQRQVHGQAMSVLFIADGKRAYVIGFNTLWTDSVDTNAPFRYGGAVNYACLDSKQRAAVKDYVAALVRALGLRGINGLDFIASESGCQVLELNPRPCATLELYDADRSTGMVAAHIRACTARQISGFSFFRPRRLRAYRVVYARRDMRMEARWHWPWWCRDLPLPWRHIRAGEPVCTVHAAGVGVQEVTAAVVARWTALTKVLDGCCWGGVAEPSPEALP